MYTINRYAFYTREMAMLFAFTVIGDEIAIPFINLMFESMIIEMTIVIILHRPTIRKFCQGKEQTRLKYSPYHRNICQNLHDNWLISQETAFFSRFFFVFWLWLAYLLIPLFLGATRNLRFHLIFQLKATKWQDFKKKFTWAWHTVVPVALPSLQL